MKDVSKRLRELRQEKGMTQDELAERLHVTRQAVSSWETKKTRPDVEMLEKICTVLGVDLMEFLYGKEKPPMDRSRIRPVVIFAVMLGMALVFRLFALPIVAALAGHGLLTAMLLGTAIRVLSGAAVPLALSVLSLYRDVALKNAGARKVCLVLGMMPAVLAGIMAIMAVALDGQQSVPEGWHGVYIGLYALLMSQYTPVIAGGLLYLGIKKPQQKREDT